MKTLSFLYLIKESGEDGMPDIINTIIVFPFPLPPLTTLEIYLIICYIILHQKSYLHHQVKKISPPSIILITKKTIG